MDNAPPTTTELRVKRAILMGLNVRSQRFELVDAASMKTYKGPMTEEARIQADGLTVGNSSFVSVVFEVEIPFFAVDEAEGETYTLTSITAIDAPPADDLQKEIGT